MQGRVAARVGDWFFSHGGNSGGRRIEDLAIDLETGVEREGFGTKQLIGDESILEARLNGEDRKPWIDVGMSEGVDDSGGAVLRITFQSGEEASAICPDGKRTILWDSNWSKVKQDFGRAAPCPR